MLGHGAVAISSVVVLEGLDFPIPADRRDGSAVNLYPGG